MRWPLLIAAAGIAAAPAIAQNWSAPPPVPGTSQLSDRGAAFRATVEAKPTRDMFARGRLIVMGGGPGGSGAACVTCHGATGGGDSSGAFPRLAQLPAWYMYKQLGDYAGETRPNPIMTPIAQQLSAADREAVSVFYALSQAEPQPPQTRAETNALQWGAALNAVGSAERGIPGCANCHGAEGEGIAPSVPNLAGQHAAYIAAQLQLWKEGTRRNDPMNVMKTIADKMTDQDIDAVADYFSRVQPVSPAPAAIPTGSVRPPARP